MKKNWKFVEIRLAGRLQIGRINVARPVKIALWLAAILLAVFACGKKNQDHSQHGAATAWQCPMRCENEKTYPQSGSCPICHMDLVKKETEPPTFQHHAAAPADLNFLLKPTYEYVLSAIKTVRPERKTLAVDIETPGYIAFDARCVQSIAARFGGRIERLYVKYPFQPVRKGQRILDIYSPEIATAQQDLIFLLEDDAANTVLIENARRRLVLLGLTAEQIAEVEEARKPMLLLPVFSPFDGFVFEREMSLPKISGSGTDGKMNDEMPSSGISAIPTASASTTEGLTLREGIYVQKGQRLFSVRSLATVWAMLEFYPSDVSAVKVGQAVSIRVEPFEKPFFGKINYIEPQFGARSKNLRARVYLENSGGNLKPGALLRATVHAGSRSGLWIPKTAALDLGRQWVVFVKTNGVFQSKKIETGGVSGAWLEVRSGISGTDEMAADAQFLMDSESFIKFN
ncbi:MAG: efflux RND transporter periplasmic adaptor subunit [Saprospiraceae bacterium]|nr:efflux RND transporter periplasmic adaptor subunit [Saprospiraceae bacterium]